MKTILFAALLSIWVVSPVRAQVLPGSSPSATVSAEATPAGIVERQVEQKPDITQPSGPAKTKLERVLEENPVGDLSYYNFLRYGVVKAVKDGVPVNTVVLILLFPLVVAIVAAARHLVGVRGVGILTPALLSVAFIATGIWVGVGLFLIILLVATWGRMVMRRLKIQYLPRLALLLWFISGAVFLTLLMAAHWSVPGVVTVGIFPILILMLLAETFIDIQQGRSGGEARDIIFQTFVLAIITSLILGWEWVQRWVLLYPELIYFGVGLFDLFMGKYTGLRLAEYFLYRGVTKEDEEE